MTGRDRFPTTYPTAQMAIPAHCAYCFESLSANLERREGLSLWQVEELWTEYTQSRADGGSGVDGTVDDEPPAQPAAISRLLNHTPSTSSSSLSTTQSSASSASAIATPSTSKTFSLSSRVSPSSGHRQESHPLFVTWNTISKSGHKSLRGCIGTFEAQELSHCLRSYALTSALEDHRFSPIPLSLLPSLQCCVTLLTNFSTPTKDPMDWTLGEHGLRISFTQNGRRHGATYLPDVPSEQGWTKEETLISLMRKGGWNGRSQDWRKVTSLELIRYEGSKVDMDYADWKVWREWVNKRVGS